MKRSQRNWQRSKLNKNLIHNNILKKPKGMGAGRGLKPLPALLLKRSFNPKTKNMENIMEKTAVAPRNTAGVVGGRAPQGGSLKCRRHATNTQSDFKPIYWQISQRPQVSVASRRKRSNEPENGFKYNRSVDGAAIELKSTPYSALISLDILVLIDIRRIQSLKN